MNLEPPASASDRTSRTRRARLGSLSERGGAAPSAALQAQDFMPSPARPYLSAQRLSWHGAYALSRCRPVPMQQASSIRMDNAVRARRGARSRSLRAQEVVPVRAQEVAEPSAVSAEFVDREACPRAAPRAPRGPSVGRARAGDMDSCVPAFHQPPHACSERASTRLRPFDTGGFAGGYERCVRQRSRDLRYLSTPKPPRANTRTNGTFGWTPLA